MLGFASFRAPPGIRDPVSLFQPRSCAELHRGVHPTTVVIIMFYSAFHYPWNTAAADIISGARPLSARNLGEPDERVPAGRALGGDVLFARHATPPPDIDIYEFYQGGLLWSRGTSPYHCQMLLSSNYSYWRGTIAPADLPLCFRAIHN